LPLSATAAGLDRRATAAGRGGIEAGRAESQHLDRIGALQGGDHAARVDRTLEGVDCINLGDIAKLPDVQPGRDVLAVRGRGKLYAAVVLRDLRHGHSF
jgi:hypothetical protein